jgi:hypothetical protein
LKTRTDEQAWLSDDPHKGKNTEGRTRSIILLRVESKYIFHENVMTLLYKRSGDFTSSGAHTYIHMSAEFIVLSGGKYRYIPGGWPAMSRHLYVHCFKLLRVRVRVRVRKICT